LTLIMSFVFNCAILKTSNFSLTGPFTRVQLSQAKQSRSLPLCVHRLHDRLYKEGWLHYDQRRQYLLFLKSCGMSLEEACSLLQYAHGRNDAEIKPKRKWERYDYDIHHMYGLRGKRVASEPFSCSRLIEMGPPKPSDGGVGGCPFNSLTNETIIQELSAMQVPTEHFFDGIVMDRGAAIKMCERHYEAVHGSKLTREGDSYPMHWTIASLNHNQKSKDTSR
jgi:DNA primase large subunit